MYTYPIVLFVISLLVAGWVFISPRRPEQSFRRYYGRPAFVSDLIFLVFNGHFLGSLLATVANAWVLPPFDHLLDTLGLRGGLYRNLAQGWPLWVQIPVLLVVLDFLQWCIHNLLHRIPWLWELHKVHHSVKDGEMDWIVSFRFHWGEVVVYKTLQYLPLAFLGFGGDALMFHAIFGTLWGHLNHANLDLGYGAWRYVLNSPRMHLWHHDADAREPKNFGILFSCWDWLFGTAYLPDGPPARLGFDGVEAFPTRFVGQNLWPLTRLWQRTQRED